MSQDYSDHYSWEGFFDGRSDCEPPEPGKHWLTITEDGEEYAVIVVRRPEGMPENDPAHMRRESDAIERAQRIVAALNASYQARPEVNAS